MRHNFRTTPTPLKKFRARKQFINNFDLVFEIYYTEKVSLLNAPSHYKMKFSHKWLQKEGIIITRFVVIIWFLRFCKETWREREREARNSRLILIAFNPNTKKWKKKTFFVAWKAFKVYIFCFSTRWWSFYCF